jgi:hypothetical protein
MDLYDVVTAIAVVVAAGFVVYMRVMSVRRRDAVEDSRILYVSGVPNVQIAFCIESSTIVPSLPMSPDAMELSLVYRVHDAIPYAWPEHADRIEARKWIVWFVRSPDQCVNFGSRLQVPWNKIPDLVGVPSERPSAGYGGMRFENHLYVATYHEGRDPTAIYCHELAHFATRHHENDQVVADAVVDLFDAVEKD